MPRSLVIEIDGKLVALPADTKNEVVERTPVTPLPLGAPLLLGLSAIHGRAVPVINLPHLMGAAAPAWNFNLLTTVAGETLAIPIDQAHGLMDVPASLPSQDVLGAAVSFDEFGSTAAPVYYPLNPLALLDRVRLHLERL